MPELHVYLHQPVAIFEARVNMPGVTTYPVTSIEFDGVTTGAFGDIVADQTLLLGSAAGLDDYGRVRVQNIATSTAIPIGRTSEGVEDGELTIVNDAYLTVWEDYRVWSKIPHIDGDGIQYKDTNVPVGTFGSQQPPVANCGPGAAGDIDSGTSVITVSFPPSGISSFAVADGATISTYAWDVGDGTITVGTSASAEITATFPAGFRYVALTVTDSNGKSHSARCPVFARNPASDTTLQQYTIERHHVEQGGQELTVRIYDDLPRATYPDGLLMMMWDGEPLAATNRTNLQFIGWHQVDEAESRGTRTGTLQGTTLDFVDVGGRLKTLPGFPQSLERAATVTNWDKMTTPTMDKYIHYILQWHSTALAVADYTPSGTGDDYPFVIFASSGDSLFDQVLNEARGLVPTYQFTVNRKGQMAVVVDPMLQDVSARTSTFQGTFDEEFIETLRFAHTRPPRVHWLRGHALLATTDYVDVGGVDTLPTLHCIAPGTAPGQGLNEVETNEGLAISQTALNSAKGHEYARLNARFANVIVDPVDDSAYVFVEPANLAWVGLDVSAPYAAQRGFTFTAARAQCKALDFRYQSGRTGMVRRSRFTLELETSGNPAITVIPEGSAYVPDETYTPPAFGDPGMFYGDINGYVAWDGAHVFRTWDLQAVSPVWALVDTGITGTIYDGQYVNVDASTIGMWLLTSTAVWWCADIMATTPSWSSVLALATVVAADAVPSSGSVVFKSMFHYWTEPGYLIVATGPNTNVTDYAHSYTWHTHDYGATWTQVDMTAYTFTALSNTSGYWRAGYHSFNVFRSAPGTIYALRSTARIGTNGRTAVFLSTDLGTTWTKGFEMTEPGDDGEMTLLHPFPAATDPTYLTRGNNGSAEVPRLYRSTDDWATGTLLANPTSYDGLAGRRRVNKRTFDNTHVMAWWLLSAGGYELRESFDQGATWATLLAGDGSNPTLQTPNGWPPDVLQWVIIRAGTSGTVPRIQLTLDNFSTMLDKEGNLFSILPGGTWTGVDTTGNGDGFALPRLGVNA